MKRLAGGDAENLSKIFGSWLVLTLALVGGGILVWGNVLVESSMQTPNLIAASLTISITFLVGWIMSWVNLRRTNTQIFPLLIRAYGFLISIGMCAVYMRGIGKCYSEQDVGFGKYALVLGLGYLALTAFYLLTEEANIRHTAIPLIMMIFLHILMLNIHYVYSGTQKINLFWVDLSFLMFLGLILRLMFTKGLYLDLRFLLSKIFPVRNS